MDWVVMSLESDPFIGVEHIDGEARFISSSGSVWVVNETDDKTIDIHVIQSKRI